MRKLVLGLVGAAALAIGSAANATVVDMNGIDSGILNEHGTESFSATIANQASFNLEFDFSLDLESFANAQVSSIFLTGHDIDFTSVLLDGWALVMTDSDADGTETWALSPGVTLAAGNHTLFVNGNIVGTSGSFGGNINITPVPEPATWGMMLLGFGAIGFAMRRRRTPMLTQLA